MTPLTVTEGHWGNTPSTRPHKDNRPCEMMMMMMIMMIMMMMMMMIMMIMMIIIMFTVTRPIIRRSGDMKILTVSGNSTHCH
jgi:uncharacterized membrane protein